jgi:hypothetical protein
LNDGLRTLVVPVSHTPPELKGSAIEIPSAIKWHLGLDDERSWVVISENNLFTGLART